MVSDCIVSPLPLSLSLPTGLFWYFSLNSIFASSDTSLSLSLGSAQSSTSRAALSKCVCVLVDDTHIYIKTSWGPLSKQEPNHIVSTPVTAQTAQFKAMGTELGGVIVAFACPTHQCSNECLYECLTGADIKVAMCVCVCVYPSLFLKTEKGALGAAVSQPAMFPSDSC